MLREDGKKFIDKRKEVLKTKLEMAERRCEENRRRIQEEKKFDATKKF